MNKDSTNQNSKMKKSESKHNSIVLDMASAIIDNTSDGVIVTNLKGEITFWNNGAVKIYQYSKEEILGKHVTLLYKAENEVSAKDRIVRVLAGEVFSNDEVKVLDKSGNTLTVLMSLNGIKDEKGRITHVFGITRDITEINKSEVELIKTKKIAEQVEQISSQLESTLDIISDGFVSLDTNWCYTFVNIKAGEFLDRSPEDLIGKNIWTEFPEAVDLPFYNVYYKAVKTQQTQYLEEFYEPLNKWFENRIYPSPGGLAIYFTDVTEKKLAENALKESEHRFSQAFDNSPIPVSILNLKTGKRLAVNSTFCKNFGYTKEELLKEENFKKKNIAVDQKEFRTIVKKLLSKGTIFEQPFSMFTKSGDVRQVLVNATRIYPDNNDVYIISYLDVTERKKAENALISSEKKFRNLAETAQVAIAIIQDPPENKFIYVNQYWEKITGYSSKEAKKLTPMDLVEPEFHKVLTKKSNKRRSTGMVSDRNEFKIITKSGETKWIKFTSTTIEFDGESANLRTGLDITKSKINEQKLLLTKENAERSENYLYNIINKIGGPIFVKDEQSKFLLVNNSFCEFLGLTRKEIIGKTLAEDISPDEQRIFLKIDRQVLKTGHKNINEELLTIPGGVTKTIVTKKTRYIDSNGKKLLIGVISDITDRKIAEEGQIQLTKIIEQSLNEIYIFDADTWLFEYVNSGAIKNLGYSMEEMANMTPVHIKPDFTEAKFSDLLVSLKSTEKTKIEFETRHLRKDKSSYPVEVHLQLIEQQNRSFYLAVILDITERKIAEENIRESEEKYRTLFEQSIVGIELAKGNEVVFENKAMINLFNYDNLEEFKKIPLIDHIAPDYRDIIKERIKDGIASKGKNVSPEYQYDILCKDGEIKTVLGHTSYMQIGGKIYAQTVVMDITERIKAEESIKETLTQLNLAVDTAKIGVSSHNIATDELVWNDELFEIFGISPSEFDYSLDAFKKMVHPEDLEYVMEQQGKAFENKPVTDINYRIIRPNNKVRYIYASATPIFDKEKNLIKIIGINLDVTEDRKAEEKLAKTNAELMDALSSLNELKKQLENQNIYLKKELDLVFNFEEMVYGSAVFSEVLTDLERVAPTDATVLILGESGTGKELLARALHNLSLRKDKTLIKVNCSAIPSELIESELFGHRKGSFTGAVSDKVGKFELADGGTLFLDEIGDLPLAMQPKLLRFLQEGEMEVVGGTTTKSLDVRIVAATNKDLKEEVNKEQFREDLYFRLNVFPIEVPPLRERKEDIPLLVEHFSNKFGKKYRKNVKYISDSAMQSLTKHSWPGNIRELENLIERSVILSDTETLNLQGFGTDNDKKNRRISSVKLTLNEVQRNHILTVLEKTNWKIDGPEGAANILDIKPSTFRDKMKKLGIKRPD